MTLLMIKIQFISCSIPTYQAEMSTEIAERGPEVAITCVFLVSGAAVAYWIDFGFNRLGSQLSWVGLITHKIFRVTDLSENRDFQ